jgi:hypothetical protein
MVRKKNNNKNEVEFWIKQCMVLHTNNIDLLV